MVFRGMFLLVDQQQISELQLRRNERLRLSNRMNETPKSMPAQSDSDRFEAGAEKYAAYLASYEGRLRIDLAFANLQELLPQAKRPLRALDLGCGTGAVGVRLAQLGIRVTLLDSSPAMLDFAKRAAQDAGVTENVEVKHGDAAQLENLFHSSSFDVILCHNVLEYVKEPLAVLRSAAVLMRDSAIMSVLVRSRSGDVLKAAIKAGDLESAERTLDATWDYESLYGGRVRLFGPGEQRTMLEAVRLEIIAERGVRVVADYLPSQISREADYEQIFQLERKLGRRPEFAAVARYSQCLAQQVPR